MLPVTLNMGHTIWVNPRKINADLYKVKVSSQILRNCYTPICEPVKIYYEKIQDLLLNLILIFKH